MVRRPGDLETWRPGDEGAVPLSHESATLFFARQNPAPINNRTKARNAIESLLAFRSHPPSPTAAIDGCLGACPAGILVCTERVTITTTLMRASPLASQASEGLPRCVCLVRIPSRQNPSALHFTRSSHSLLRFSSAPPIFDGIGEFGGRAPPTWQLTFASIRQSSQGHLQQP